MNTNANKAAASKYGFQSRLQNMGSNFGSSLKQSLYGFTGSIATSNMNTPTAEPTKPRKSSKTRKPTKPISAQRKPAKPVAGQKKQQLGVSENVARPYKSARKKSMDNSSPRSRNTRTPKSQYSKQHIRRRSLLMGSTLYQNSDNEELEEIIPKSKMPKNFYPPESFINFLYRVTELDKNVNRFSLCILDIDNLRGHIQSPLQKSSPHKKKKKDMQPPSKYHQLPVIDMHEQKELSQNPTRTPSKRESKQTPNENSDSDGFELVDDHLQSKKPLSLHSHTKSNPQPSRSVEQSRNRESRPVSENEDKNEEEDESLDDYDRSNSPLSNNNHTPVAVADEAKYIDDQDLQSARSHDKDEDEIHANNVKTVAERTAIINHSRRESSLLMQQSMYKQHFSYESGSDSDTIVVKMENEEKGDGKRRRNSKKKLTPMMDGDRSGRILQVGDNNFDPYLLFWNNSKRGESVVKVVQDVILMSISNSINMTHFGFGEFALLGNVNQETEMRILVKKVLNKVSSNVSTVKLGPVTLCAGICMYNKGISVSQWVNRCRQACRMSKNNGRGRVFHYISQDKRQQLAIEMILEIKKPIADFSPHRILQLIKEGADVNFQLDHNTPLMIAIKAHNMQATRFLIQYDYNPNIQNRKGKTPLILALERKCDHIILDMLVSKRDLNPRLRDCNKSTALAIALKDGYREIAKTLILLGAEPILGEKMVLKQWFNAAKNCDILTIESMLDGLSFPVDMIDIQDMTALMHACKAGHLELTKVLLHRGCNVNIQGYRGYTALMFACENGKGYIFDYLLQTCLMMNKQQLLEIGIESKENENSGVLEEITIEENEQSMMNGLTEEQLINGVLNEEMAKERARSQTQPLLIGLVADDQTTILMCAARGGLPAVVQIAIEFGKVDVNARDIFGNTALMVACKYDSQSVAIELLRHYADLDLQNKKGQNSLMLCSMSGASRIASMLITLGSAIDVQDADGKTALMYAAQNGYLAIIVNLLKYGADTTETLDCHGLNASQLAKKFEQHEISDMIESGQLQDSEDILEKMEIYKKKYEMLEKAMEDLNQMNEKLAKKLKRSERHKKQLALKLQQSMSGVTGAMNKMTSFGSSLVGLSKFRSSVSTRSRAGTTVHVPQPPGKNYKL